MMRFRTLQLRIAVSRIAQRAVELFAHTYVPILEQYTFSTQWYSVIVHATQIDQNL
jgi:hypothetical protein